MNCQHIFHKGICVRCGDLARWFDTLLDQDCEVVVGDGYRAPSVAAEVVGYRLFELAPSGTLNPIAHMGSAWVSGVNAAICQSGCSSIPDPAHHCGFYGFWDVGRAYTTMIAEYRPLVLAAVAYSGRIVPHTFGFRSSHARVLAVLAPAKACAAIQAQYPDAALLAHTPAYKRTNRRGMIANPEQMAQFKKFVENHQAGLLVHDKHGNITPAPEVTTPAVINTTVLTVIPCRKCGLVERYANGSCAPCKRAAAARYNARRR